MSRRPSYATVVAHLALVVALSGGAAAAVTITGANIKNGSLTGADVKKGSLIGADLKAGSLTGTQVKKHSIPLDRLSASLPLQYYSRAQSDARFLAAGGTAGHALTAGSATTATSADTATNAINATNATNATNAAALGGLPASAYAKGSVTTIANRLDVPIFTSSSTVVLTVPGFATVSAVSCNSSGSQAIVANSGSAGLAWFELSGTTTAQFAASGWSAIASPFAPAGWISLHLSVGTGATTRLADIDVHTALDGATCEFLAKATIYG